MGRVDLQRNRKSTKGAAILIDKDTFCEQIRLHEKAMYYLAFSLVQNEADAADVIGEAILRAYKNIDGLKSEKAFKPWLLKIIHNTAVEYIRKNAKTISSQEIDVAVENDIETKLTLCRIIRICRLVFNRRSTVGISIKGRRAYRISVVVLCIARHMADARRFPAHS